MPCSPNGLRELHYRQCIGGEWVEGWVSLTEVCGATPTGNLAAGRCQVAGCCDPVMACPVTAAINRGWSPADVMELVKAMKSGG